MEEVNDSSVLLKFLSDEIHIFSTERVSGIEGRHSYIWAATNKNRVRADNKKGNVWHVNCIDRPWNDTGGWIEKEELNPYKLLLFEFHQFDLYWTWDGLLASCDPVEPPTPSPCIPPPQLLPKSTPPIHIVPCEILAAQHFSQ